jgi:lysophospholipase L1-like esterase
MIDDMATLIEVSAARKDVDCALRALNVYIDGSHPDTEGYKRLFADLERAVENLRKVISECGNTDASLSIRSKH